jgi:predicted TPR repeat methyltransferase
MSAPDYSPAIVAKMQQANQLKSEGLYAEAVNMLKAVLAEDPECAPAYNNIGTIYYALRDYPLAIQAYQFALDYRPDYIDAYYNLGLAFGKMHRHDEALTVYRALLMLAPNHPGAHFQLGSLLMRRQQFVEAANEFTLMLDLFPEHFETLSNIAVCYLRLGRISQAAECYLRALEVVPDDREILFNLGVIHMQQGYAEAGLNYYLRAVKAHPDFFDAHHNLGAIYLMRRDYENALLHFREALRIKPDTEALRHTIKIMMRDKNLTGSSPEYIQALFDSYADYYDAHLRAHLHYQVPEKLYSALVDWKVLASHQLSILDIGCGTGLCGELFKPHARQLIGVDLSPKMLAVAAEKNLYDELIAADALSYLATHPAPFDLVLAGDVLVYFGELNSLVAAVSQSLTPQGCFAFNVEITTEQDYILTVSGRFAHHQNYLERIAEENGFEILSMHPDALRQQEAEPVQGYLCVWRLT